MAFCCITIQQYCAIRTMNQVKVQDRKERLPQQEGVSGSRFEWNGGPWTEQENIKCIAFLDYNRHELNSKLKIKENKFFKQLSTFVVSRSPIQCRSQCYKLLRKHKTFNNVISSFRHNEANPDFRLIYDNLREDPNIRFKGAREMAQNQSNHKTNMKDVQIQTDKSYLLKAYVKSHPEPKTRPPEPNDINDYPFLKAGWLF